MITCSDEGLPEENLGSCERGCALTALFFAALAKTCDFHENRSGAQGLQIRPICCRFIRTKGIRR
jgi:hypothetical protein